MKITYEQWKVRLNGRLETYDQRVRVVDFGKATLELSTGEILIQPEFGKFKKRVMNIKTDLWVKNMDLLLAGLITDREIKAKLAAIGGKAVHKLHPELSSHNLNTGVPWNKGKTGLQTSWAKGLTKHTDSRIASRANSGEANGMHGVKMSDQDKQHRSDVMKAKILAGDFTPNSNNRNTHWAAEFNGKKYRSSWEALFQYMYPDAEYETLRLEYTINGNRKIYIADFVDYETKQVAEVKPAELCKGEIFDAKIVALNEWANQNGFRVIIVTQEWLLTNGCPTDLSGFDEKTATKIRKLYEANKKN